MAQNDVMKSNEGNKTEPETSDSEQDEMYRPPESTVCGVRVSEIKLAIPPHNFQQDVQNAYQPVAFRQEINRHVSTNSNIELPDLPKMESNAISPGARSVDKINKSNKWRTLLCIYIIIIHLVLAYCALGVTYLAFYASYDDILHQDAKTVSHFNYKPIHDLQLNVSNIMDILNETQSELISNRKYIKIGDNISNANYKTVQDLQLNVSNIMDKLNETQSDVISNRKYIKIGDNISNANYKTIQDLQSNLSNIMVILRGNATSSNYKLIQDLASNISYIITTLNETVTSLESEIDSNKKSLQYEVSNIWDTVNDTVIDIEDINKTVNYNKPKKGTIVIWYGLIEDIPEGWILCDGNNSTPDLRDVFVMGAGNMYNLNDIGGNRYKTLSINNIPSHRHYLENITLTDNGQHNHSLNVNTSITNGHIHDIDVSMENNGEHTHSFTGSASTQSSHQHYVSLGTTTASAHTHYFSDTTSSSGSHSHTYQSQSASGGWTSTWGESGYYVQDTTSTNGAHTHTVSGNTGSSGSHSHTISGNTGSDGSHTHSIGGSNTISGLHKHAVYVNNTLSGIHYHVINGYTNSDSLHSHNLVSGITDSVGSTSSFEILNPFYSAYYIMKL